jgi:hypothetical protein
MITDAVAPASPWRAVGFVVDFQTREKTLGLLSDTMAWIAALALFRKTETETHYLAETALQDRQEHRAILCSLIAAGDRLLNRILDAGGLPANLDGVGTADIAAMVEELRITDLQWYGDMTPDRREEILKQIFNGTKP